MNIVVVFVFFKRKSYQQFVDSKKTAIFAVPNSERENNNAKYIK
jgi:hypothetical protein